MLSTTQVRRPRANRFPEPHWDVKATATDVQVSKISLGQLPPAAVIRPGWPPDLRAPHVLPQRGRVMQAAGGDHGYGGGRDRGAPFSAEPAGHTLRKISEGRRARSQAFLMQGAWHRPGTTRSAGPALRQPAAGRSGPPSMRASIRCRWIVVPMLPMRLLRCVAQP